MEPEEKKINAQQRTWNEFWGEFLLVNFHKDNPDKWKPVEKKADWIWEIAKLKNGSRVLDLGCGSGMLDICLAKSGAEVTAIDRIEPVLAAARKEAGNLSVCFITDDIKTINYPEGSFDCILFLETAGLMNKKQDKELIEKSFYMLKQNGIFIIDSPEPGHSENNYWEKDTAEGRLTFKTVYDHKNSVQTITPELITNEGSLIELCDPYNTDISIHKGVKRYLYKKEELKAIAEAAGYFVREADHYWGEKYNALVCT